MRPWNKNDNIKHKGGVHHLWVFGTNFVLYIRIFSHKRKELHGIMVKLINYLHLSLSISLHFQRLKIILYSCTKSQIFCLYLSYLQCCASICFMGWDHCQKSYIHDLISFSSMFYQHSDSWFRTYSANGASLLDYTIMHLYIIYYTLYIQTCVSMYIHAEEK